MTAIHSEFRNAADLLRSIDCEIAAEDNSANHRYFALLWLWDFVKANASGGLVELTAAQLSILNR